MSLIAERVLIIESDNMCLTDNEKLRRNQFEQKIIDMMFPNENKRVPLEHLIDLVRNETGASRIECIIALINNFEDIDKSINELK